MAPGFHRWERRPGCVGALRAHLTAACRDPARRHDAMQPGMSVPVSPRAGMAAMTSLSVGLAFYPAKRISRVRWGGWPRFGQQLCTVIPSLSLKLI